MILKSDVTCRCC